jgi:hypothetical protein
MTKEKQPKEDNLSERVRKWYESYDNPPPWSSVAGFVIREVVKERGKIGVEMYNKGYEMAYEERMKITEVDIKQIRQKALSEVEREIKKWNSSGFMSDCLGEKHWKNLLEIINKLKK